MYLFFIKKLKYSNIYDYYLIYYSQKMLPIDILSVVYKYLKFASKRKFRMMCKASTKFHVEKKNLINFSSLYNYMIEKLNIIGILHIVERGKYFPPENFEYPRQNISTESIITESNMNYIIDHVCYKLYQDFSGLDEYRSESENENDNNKSNDRNVSDNITKCYKENYENNLNCSNYEGLMVEYDIICNCSKHGDINDGTTEDGDDLKIYKFTDKIIFYRMYSYERNSIVDTYNTKEYYGETVFRQISIHTRNEQFIDTLLNRVQKQSRRNKFNFDL